MKSKILMLIIGILIGAIITSAGFLIFGNNNKGTKDFDPSQFKNGNGTPPNFSIDKKDMDFENFDPSNFPQRPTE
ncbi:MAG: hypothetical protein IKD77_00075 [Bacilli bacterium]|nr:hypothetical protein [Bacilli bacterium]